MLEVVISWSFWAIGIAYLYENQSEGYAIDKKTYCKFATAGEIRH